MIPVSRGEAAEYLLAIKKEFKRLTPIDKQILSDYELEFEYDMYGQTSKQYSFLSRPDLKKLFNNNLQKYLLYYTDSNATNFTDIYGFLSLRGSEGHTFGNNSILLGQYGFNTRGTIFKSVAYYLNFSNERFINDYNFRKISFVLKNDPLLRANPEFKKNRKNFFRFSGYLRYQTDNEWFGLTFGRTQLNMGTGYIDRLILSNNTLPFDFVNLGIKYKAVNYSFVYGNLSGDSTEIFPRRERPLSSKTIAAHRLTINFSNQLRVGLWEAVIASDQPFSFTYLNPVSFLTSADLSTGRDQSNENNSLIGIDAEVNAFKNFSFQSSLLIDDLTFGTLFKKDSLNENKFGWQIGALWTNPLNMSIAVEYTHLDPFVYSHRSNKSTYTHHLQSLGHALPPNSDEIALKLIYDITNRVRLHFIFQHQRSGEGLVFDSLGNFVANYGGDINFGFGDAYLRTNGFLDGRRVNRDVFNLELSWQPVWQFFLEGKFRYKIENDLYRNIKFKDTYYVLTARAGF